MIQVAQLQKAYRDGEQTVQVLRGLSFDVERGEFVAIVGRSGSGKSTLLHVLGGLDTDFSGEVQVDGVRLGGLEDRALANFRHAHVGFVFQSFHLVPQMSALENVMLPAHFSAEGPVGDEVARATRSLERVGLGGKTDRAPAKLSGGERQRVAIARALFMKPPVLLCDEPTGNLDAETGAEIIDLFRSLHAEGQTLVVVTHEEQMRKAAGRVVTLESGMLVSGGGAK